MLQRAASKASRGASFPPEILSLTPRWPLPASLYTIERFSGTRVTFARVVTPLRPLPSSVGVKKQNRKDREDSEDLAKSAQKF